MNNIGGGRRGMMGDGLGGLVREKDGRERLRQMGAWRERGWRRYEAHVRGERIVSGRKSVKGKRKRKDGSIL